MAAVMEGQVDQIILTGGIAYGQDRGRHHRYGGLDAPISGIPAMMSCCTVPGPCGTQRRGACPRADLTRLSNAKGSRSTRAVAFILC